MTLFGSLSTLLQPSSSLTRNLVPSTAVRFLHVHGRDAGLLGERRVRRSRCSFHPLLNRPSSLPQEESSSKYLPSLIRTFKAFDSNARLAISSLIELLKLVARSSTASFPRFVQAFPKEACAAYQVYADREGLYTLLLDSLKVHMGFVPILQRPSGHADALLVLPQETPLTDSLGMDISAVSFAAIFSTLSLHLPRSVEFPIVSPDPLDGLKLLALRFESDPQIQALLQFLPAFDRGHPLLPENTANSSTSEARLVSILRASKDRTVKSLAPRRYDEAKEATRRHARISSNNLSRPAPPSCSS